jgi:hypothetical protein
VHGTVRVCERCLEAGDINARLEKHAAHLDAQAGLVRKLIGQLKVPSYAEWQAREKRVDVAMVADLFGYDYETVLNDDAVFEQCRKDVERAYPSTTPAETTDALPF